MYSRYEYTPCTQLRNSAKLPQSPDYHVSFATDQSSSLLNIEAYKTVRGDLNMVSIEGVIRQNAVGLSGKGCRGSGYEGATCPVKPLPLSAQAEVTLDDPLRCVPNAHWGLKEQYNNSRLAIT